MKVLETTLERLIEQFGEPDIAQGITHWDISFEGDWFMVWYCARSRMFKVESVLGFFTRAINEEIAFINYFENKYT